MRHILSRSSHPILEELSRSNAMLGFDFDGTLCPIVSDPQDARLAPTTQGLLEEIARLYPCVVISGRAARDLRRRLIGVELAGVIGNHGLEPTHGTQALRRLVERWRTLLAPRLASIVGVELEDKHYSLAIHYRGTRSKSRARAAIVEALGVLGAVRVVGGKQVVSILPVGAPHKGKAFDHEVKRLACDGGLFVGDDQTDEDVFASPRPGKLVTVRVGRARSSHASFYLRNQSEIDPLLSLLIDLRAHAHGQRRAEHPPRPRSSGR